ncbi:MAG TPA: hypothetical protein VHT97_01035 [Acidimicrobiales bacterium]|jgi:hypothetical protein|nr:hypothetical protein [Acidimicrobiales bacterium]
MRIRRFAVATMGAGFAGIVLLAATAWACVPVATLNLSTTQAKAGQDIGITGNSYNGAKPAVVHFNAIDGPVLGSFVPNGGRIDGTVTIPAGTAPGNYLLVVTQEFTQGVQTWGVPARALISVTGDTGAPVLGAAVGSSVAGRPVGLESSSSPSGASLLLVAGAAGGVAMFLAGLAAVVAARNTPAPSAAKVKA